MSPTVVETSSPTIAMELTNTTDSGDNDRRLKISVSSLVSGAAAMEAAMGGGLVFYDHKTGASIEPDF
jgi:hypothetical protein